MPRIFSIFPLIALLLFISSCATAPKGAYVVNKPDELPSIQQKDAAVLAKLKVGMPLSEFQKLIPKAFEAGKKDETTAYELDQVQKYVTRSDINWQNFWLGFGSPRARTNKQVLWFYFYNRQLVKWGRPKDWPARPDLIIKKRTR